MQRQMATLHVKPKVEDVVLLLQTVQHNAFPVVESTQIATTPYIAEYIRSSKSSDRPSSSGQRGDISISECRDWRQVEQVNQPVQGVIGTISRHILLRLLKLRHYSVVDNGGATISPLPWLSISQLDTTWPNVVDKEAEREILQHYSGGIPTDVVNATLDLAPYLNPNPFIVSEWSTAADVREFSFLFGNH